MIYTTRSVTYPLPDEVFSTERTLNLTAEWTYEGPDKAWVFVSYETNKLIPQEGVHPWDEKKSFERQYQEWDIYTGLNSYPVLLDIDDPDDVILMLTVAQNIKDPATLPQKEFFVEGEDEPFATLPYPTPPYYLFDPGNLSYDPETEDWSDVPFVSQPISAEKWLENHHLQIAAYESVNTEKYTAEQKTIWDNFLTEFKNVETRFAEYLHNPWIIPYPLDPRFEIDIWGTDGDTDLIDPTRDPVVAVPPPKIFIEPEPAPVGIALTIQDAIDQATSRDWRTPWSRAIDGIWVVGPYPGRPIKYDVLKRVPEQIPRDYTEEDFITEEEAAELHAQAQEINHT